MKKIILGLFLTTGFTSVLFAKNDVRLSSINIIKTKYKNLKPLECKISTIKNYVDQNGKLFKSEQSSWQTIPCGNAPDGTMVIKTEVVRVVLLEASYDLN